MGVSKKQVLALLLGKILDWEDCLEKEMTTHFSILAWKILWREASGRL